MVTDIELGRSEGGDLGWNQESRVRLVLLAAALSFLIGVLAQALLASARQPSHPRGLAWVATLGPSIALALFAAAAIIAVLVERMARRGDSYLWRAAALPPTEAPRHRLSAWDCLPPLLSIGAAAAAIVILPGFTSHGTIWVLGGVSALAAGWGLWRIRRRAWGDESSASVEHRSAPELAAIVLVLLVAVALRGSGIDSVPSGIFFDEAQNGLDAVEILQEGVHLIWSDSLSGRPTLHLHILAGVFRLVGIRVISMKWVSIAFGVLAVAAVYSFSRRLFGRPTALIAAAILATSHYHIHYSRLIFEAVMTPLLITMAVHLVWRATRRGHWWDFALAAVMLAAGLYTYVSFRIVPLLFVPFGLHLVFSEQGFLRRNLPGLLCAAAILALLLIPLGRFALNNPARFFNRFSEVSLTSEIEREGSLQPAIRNVTGYLTMFNFRGDGNRVQNLPGEPAFSFLPSIFFVLGAALSLRHGRDPRHALLLFWFFVGLLPGALTHSIETPHSTRVIAALPAAAILAALGLNNLWRAIAERSVPVEGHRRGAWLVAGSSVVVAILVASGVMDYQTYFVKQRSDLGCYYAFNPDANRLGRLIEGLAKDYHILVSPSYRYVFPEDAVVEFVAYNALGYEGLDYVRDIPYKGEASKGIAYLLEPAFENVVSLLCSWYPSGELRRYRDPYGGTLFLSYLVPRGDVLAVRGLEGTYAFGDGGDVTRVQADLSSGFVWQANASANLTNAQAELATAPAGLPSRIDWSGSLYIPTYGLYALDRKAGGDVALYINGELVEWNQELGLPKGLHKVEVTYEPAGPDDGLRLFWQGPGIARDVIPSESLYARQAPTHGLEATYYRNHEWRGSAASIQLDPLVFANSYLLEGTFSITWRGQILIPQEGVYMFGADSDDGSMLYLDGDLLVDNGGTHGPVYREGSRSLSRGWHDIRIDYSQNGGGMGLSLYWAPPGRPRTLLPESQFRYPVGAWDTEAIEEPPAPLAKQDATYELQPFAVGPLVVKWGKEGSGKGAFREPRGIGVGPDGRVYVADTGNRRIQSFDANGRFLTAWERGDRPMEKPWDIIVSGSGEVWVLDAGPNWIYRFDGDGRYLGKAGGPEAHLYQPRGMSKDALGNVYVADTGGHRVVMFDAAGEIVGAYGREGTAPGQMLEPTDVAIAPTGEMFILDNSNRRVQRWDASATYVGEWTIPVANAHNGPHIAMLSDGSMFFTVPELHEIWRYSPAGEVLGEWGGEGQFRVPTDLALDGDEYLYVADTLNHQVQKYQIVRRP